MDQDSDDLSIPQRILRAALSPSHRQIADYVLDYPLRVAAMRVEELAEIVGVSVPTANRFARALGFDGYAQFRTALVLGFEATLAPVEKLRARSDQPASAAAVMAETIHNITRNISRTTQGLEEQGCTAAVTAILTARRLHILGYGASAWLAGLLMRRLELYCEDVRLLSSIESTSYAGRAIRHVGPGDLAIAIAFPRYMTDTLTIAQRMRAAGAAVLGLTDGAHSPLVPLSTLTLYASSDSAHFSTCEASALALIEALTAAVAQGSGRSMAAATELAESVLPWLHGSHAPALRPFDERSKPAPAGTAKHRRQPD